jgi:hypothetical protein
MPPARHRFRNTRSMAWNAAPKFTMAPSPWRKMVVRQRRRALVGERADHADAALLVRLGHVRDPPAAGAPLDSDGPRRAWQRVRDRGAGRCSGTRSFTGHRHAANVRVLAHFVARASVGRGVRPVHGPKLDQKFYDPIFNFVKPKFTSGLPVLEDLSSGITSSRRSLPRAFSECRCRDSVFEDAAGPGRQSRNRLLCGPIRDWAGASNARSRPH